MGQVRITAVRNEEIDVERLAAALLALAVQLAVARPPTDKQERRQPENEHGK